MTASPIRPVPADDPDGTPTDTAALFEGLREQIAVARRQRSGQSLPVASTAAAPTSLNALLAQGTDLAEIGATLPSFAHLSWPRRVIARGVGRMLLYLLRLVTVDQHRFNRVVLLGLQRVATDAAASAARMDDLRASLEASRHRQEEIASHLARILDMAAYNRELLRSQNAAIAELRETASLLLMQTDAVKRLLASGSQPLGAGTRAAEAHCVPLAPSGVDEAMRGSPESIKERQQRYLPYFAGAVDVLDVGCGAGPFLELLRDAGISAHGVELDPDLALWCQERGLTVRCADALEYLAGLPDQALGGLFCAQVIEHLRPHALLQLIQLAARTLRPGAPIVIETLNPESLLVHYRWFWMNLTHERLIHPDTLAYLLRSHGFRDVHCELAPPPEGPLSIPALELLGEAPGRAHEFNSATQYLNRLLYGSYDYAAIAVR